MNRVLVTCPQMVADLPRFLGELEDAGIEAVPLVAAQVVTRDELLEHLPGCIAILAGDETIDASIMDAAPSLRLIARWGVGIDGVDLPAAAARSIVVLNTPGVFDDVVADVALGYLILLARQIHRIDAGVRIGGWPKPVGWALQGKVLGLIGLGGIGSAFARRAITVGMTVIGSDPDERRQAGATALGIEVVGLDQVLARCDVLSLHCPLTPATHRIIDRAAIERIRPGSYVVNTSRGPLVDEDALIDALRSGHIAGAALDVFEAEPLPAGSPLRQFEQVILGSHNASNAAEAARRVSELAVANLVRHLGAPAS